MEVMTIESEAFKQVMSKLDTIYMCVIGSSKKEPDESRWMNTEEVCELLRISKRTLQRLRKAKRIRYTVFNRKCIYKLSDVETLALSNVVSCDINHFENHKNDNPPLKTK